MPDAWRQQILSLIQPLSFALVTRKLSRSQLLEWAGCLEGVAREMRERAGEDRDK